MMLEKAGISLVSPENLFSLISRHNSVYIAAVWSKRTKTPRACGVEPCRIPRFSRSLLIQRCSWYCNRCRRTRRHFASMYLSCTGRRSVCVAICLTVYCSHLIVSLFFCSLTVISKKTRPSRGGSCKNKMNAECCRPIAGVHTAQLT